MSLYLCQHLAISLLTVLVDGAIAHCGLICLSLMAGDAERLFMRPFAVCITFLVKCFCAFFFFLRGAGKEGVNSFGFIFYILFLNNSLYSILFCMGSRCIA